MALDTFFAFSGVEAKQLTADQTAIEADATTVDRA